MSVLIVVFASVALEIVLFQDPIILIPVGVFWGVAFVRLLRYLSKEVYLYLEGTDVLFGSLLKEERAGIDEVTDLHKVRFSYNSYSLKIRNRLYYFGGSESSTKGLSELLNKERR